MTRRCCWCNEKNPLYIAYHDYEWGIPVRDDEALFELLILESFQAGLSWETVLNKRESFRRAFDSFDPKLISQYDENKIDTLMQNRNIIRNRRKITAVIKNARIFLDIKKEFGSFLAYIESFTGKTVIFECDRVTSPLSERLSADLIRRGMRFVGSTIIYSFLQATGFIYSHEEGCFLHKK